MEIVIRSIKMPICHTEQDVIKAAQEIVRLHCVSADKFRISKQSLDARKKMLFIMSTALLQRRRTILYAMVKPYARQSRREVLKSLKKNLPKDP